MIYGLCALSIAVIALVLIILTKKIFIIKVKGSSMEPTLFNNDYVLGYRTDVFNTSDIVVANVKYPSSPNGQVTVIKRIESIIYESASPRLFLTGDNKGYSIDSRDKAFGTVPIDQVIGKVIWY